NSNDLLPAVKADIDKFVGQAPQFDDITMLSIELVPQKEAEMTKLSVKPTLENIDNVTMFVEEKLRDGGIKEKIIAVIDVAVDEIFSNIVHYSGATEATVGVRIWNGLITLRFADNGIHYDPTCKKDPDTDAPAEERNIGGLGIFIVKKTMNSMKYNYLEGFNILTLEKSAEA
ncbi:MAG: ATP-binding protein, partial [Lachnospiraceae bacterium]